MMNDHPWKDHPGLESVAAFHGHMCPGLAIGYRAAVAGLARLGVTRAADEELLAIVENDSCSVDALQQLAGTTFGKGNLLFRDWGKQVFTLARRGNKASGETASAVRLALRWEARQKASAHEEESVMRRIRAGKAGADEQRLADSWKRRKIEYLLAAPDHELFAITEIEITLPPRAAIHGSVRCDQCDEQVMETRVKKAAGRKLCPECALIDQEQRKQ